MKIHAFVLRALATAAIASVSACGGGGDAAGSGSTTAAAETGTLAGAGDGLTPASGGGTPAYGSGTGISTGTGTAGGGGTSDAGSTTTAGGPGSVGSSATGTPGASGQSGATTTTGNGSGALGGNDVIASAGDLQTSVPTAGYADGSLGGNTYSTLNEVRQASAAGLLQHSAQLDTAASAHAAFLTSNIGAAGHLEDPSKLVFYELSPASRIAKSGFAAGYSTEVINASGTLLTSNCVRQLLDTVYQAVELLGPATHVGFGFGNSYAATPLCVGNLATVAGDVWGQVAGAGSLMAYPYPGQDRVSPLIDIDFDTPRPSPALFPNTVTGKPVIIGLRNADYLNYKAAGSLNVVISRFELKDGSGNLVPSAILAHPALRASDGVLLYADANLPEGFAALVPFEPLQSHQTYIASFSATLKTGGAALQQRWSFTTGR